MNARPNVGQELRTFLRDAYPLMIGIVSLQISVSLQHQFFVTSCYSCKQTNLQNLGPPVLALITLDLCDSSQNALLGSIMTGE